LSKSERKRYRVWFVILAILTLCSGIYLSTLKVLRYYHTEPLMNLDIPLLLYAEESLEYDIRLRNTGEHTITVKDVRLEGKGFILGPGAWTLDTEAGENQIASYKEPSQDAVLHLHLEGQKTLSQSTKILIIYQYGWLRSGMVLEIKTELSS